MTPDQRKSFVAIMIPIAKNEQIRSNIQPIITITQAAHESGWGLSKLTVRANNLFGFTGEAWETAGKPIIKLPTKEYVKQEWVTVLRPFRAYLSWDDSVHDWANLMMFPRYKLALIAAINGDVKEFAKQVASAGYATDPNYANSLVAVSKSVSEAMG